MLRIEIGLIVENHTNSLKGRRTPQNTIGLCSIPKRFRVAAIGFRGTARAFRYCVATSG
jgi:hypothetical protein